MLTQTSRQSERVQPREPARLPALLLGATVAWIVMAILAAPLFVHPYLINGFHHATHFDSIVWTMSFVVIVATVVPLFVWWWKQLQR